MNQRTLRQAPIEPLSYQAWQRVETAVFARLDDGVVMPMPVSPHHSYAAPRTRRPLRWHWAVSMGLSVAAAAAASVVHVAYSRSTAPFDSDVPALPARLAAAPDDLAVALPRAPVAPTAVEAPLAALPAVPPAAATATAHDGLHVTTGRETRSIAVGDCRFTLSERTELVARGNDQDGWSVDLTRGRVEFDVAPRLNRPPFIIHSGDVQVRVVGTLFDVRRQGPSTEVRVQRGVVEVEHGGQTTRLGPGDFWHGGVVSGATRASEPSKSAHARGPRSERSVARSDRERRFERAASLESDDPVQALDVYLALARGADAWAANALYAAARLELDQGDGASGARLLEDYLERFPEGENRLDVQELRSRLGMPAEQ